MPPKRKNLLESDDDYRAPPASKRTRREIEEDFFFETSSAPASPNPAHSIAGSDEEEGEMEEGNGVRTPLPGLMSKLVGLGATGEPSVSIGATADSTPRKPRPRAASESPAHIPSPATSTVFESPLKPKGGRPRGKKPKKHLREFSSAFTPSESLAGSSSSAQIQTTARAAKRRENYAAAAAARRKEAEGEADRAAEAGEIRQREANEQAADEQGAAHARAALDLENKRARAQAYLEKLTAPENEGGAGFDTPMDWFETLMSSKGDAQAAANLTRFFKSNGAEIIDIIIDRVPAVGQELLDKKFDEKLESLLQAEGRAIQKLLTRGSSTSIMELLDRFSMEELGDELEIVAPTLWRILETTAAPSRSTRRENQGEARREKRLHRNSEIEVLAHAGLSMSYTAIRAHLSTLSKEAGEKFRKLVKEQMFSYRLGQLNIAFRVESQRLNSGNHFDNGTTATAIPLYNPFTGSTKSPHGTLPLDYETSAHDYFSCSRVGLHRCPAVAIKRLAFENIKNLDGLRKNFEDCIEVDQIAVHKTEQYPLPAMHEDESSIEGTIRVYTQILQNLGLADADLKAHGLMFNDGDLLTDSLVEKMAGCRMVLNEHWGKPNSLWPGSLWWEHTKLLKRKPISAGWKAKATPWKPSHELLQISLAAHVKDGFRIHCGSEDLDTWALSATMGDLNAVAERVYRKLFTTQAVDDLRAMPERDITHENTVLLNRDALYYVEFVAAIKKGDIGRVINVLQIWMVMMRTPKTMPKYADAIFETLRRIDRYDPVLNFKEVDLLQEHQNFWAKIIYNAKGVNRSWDWLAMISVCIFTLRDTMRTVQKTFKITGYGECHTVPDMLKEEEKIQEYVQNRPANDPEDSTAVTPVRDLLEEGSKYADTRTAFKKFTKEVRRAENLGLVEGEDGAREDDGAMDDDEHSGRDEYQVTAEDLDMDDEESYANADAMVAAASEVVTNYV
ncbi:hypothetical protein B0H14DRAFT_2589082 [Mycena olivaceomarginata]|nr:hypothetical protein B0H14DRAFT_2589082 [Mycena olivaceomarginata]